MPDSLFNVEQSFLKSRWVMPDVAMDVIERVARRFDLPESVARLLCARQVPEDRIESFLKPTLKNDFPDPLSMMGMAAMADAVADAIIEKKNISIFGDFD
ncbi:MAG: single-stranded-DNA-specific exonuclease RecJ, partial [Alphaproteobacteria bacterium]